MFGIRQALQCANEYNESFHFGINLFLKAGCLHFLSAVVNEHQWDPAAMRQGQGWGENYPSDLREMLQISALDVSSMKSLPILLAARVRVRALNCSGVCNSGSVLESGLRWQEREGERDM